MLAQPKRLALLAYLAAARPLGFHRRDTLLALFWPESDDRRARDALAQATRFLRQALGEEALVSRGAQELGIAPEPVWCDVAAFELLASEGRAEQALELYRGDLLPGFFVSEAPEFDRWLESRRAELRRQAAELAWGAAAAATQRGDPATAARFARRAHLLNPDDEGALRRLVALLAESGDRAGALAAYRAFAAQLESDYGAEPAPETRQLIAEIRAAQAAAELETRPAPTAPTIPPVPRDHTLVPVAGSRRGRRRWWAAGMWAVGLAAIAAWVAWRQLPPSSAAATPTIVAVLPFADRTPGRTREYLADGIAEELMEALARVPSLRVVARTSAFQFRGRDLDVREVGRRLNAGSVVEGSVESDGERVKVTARLVDARNGYRLWSNTYERELKDVFAIEEEIGRAVAQALRVELGADALARRETASARAHDLYLQARFHWSRRTERDIQVATELFRQAVALDSTYARAYAGLAEAYVVLPTIAGAAYDDRIWADARAAASRAIALDSTLSQAHAALALTHTREWEWARAEAEFQRALALDPGNATAHQWYGVFLSSGGQAAAAIRALERARALDPQSLAVNAELCWAFYAGRRAEEAVAQCRRTIALDPTFALAHRRLLNVYEGLGRYADAVDEMERLAAMGGRDAPTREEVLAARRGHETAGASGYWRARLQWTTRYGSSPLAEARIHAALGDTERAVALLLRHAERRGYTGLFADPIFDAVRSDPRRRDALRRVGYRL